MVLRKWRILFLLNILENAFFAVKLGGEKILNLTFPPLKYALASIKTDDIVCFIKGCFFMS